MIKEQRRGRKHPKRAKPPPRKRTSLISGRVGLAHDEAVIAWVTDRLVDRWPRDRVVAASKAGEHGWPLADTDGGRGLNHGSYESVRAIIADRERRETQREAPGRQRTARSRTAKLNAERRNGSDSDIVLAQLQIVKQTGILESTDLISCGLDAVNQDSLRRIFDDLGDLQSWMDYSRSVVVARMDEVNTRNKIKELRNKTVANGCTAAEEASARRLADKVESQLEARLSA